MMHTDPRHWHAHVNHDPEQSYLCPDQQYAVDKMVTVLDNLAYLNDFAVDWEAFQHTLRATGVATVAGDTFHIAACPHPWHMCV